MKIFLTAAATVALLAGAGVASAQTIQPMPPQPMQTYQPMYQGPVQPMQQPTTTSGTMATPSWMQDDGSSSDHPIHNSNDWSANRLNSEYQGGITVPPGQGFPALPNQQ